jgi:hypothetical protein
VTPPITFHGVAERGHQPGAAALKINVPASINNAYNDKKFRTTLVLLFNSQVPSREKRCTCCNTRRTRSPTSNRPNGNPGRVSADKP